MTAKGVGRQPFPGGYAGRPGALLYDEADHPAVDPWAPALELAGLPLAEAVLRSRRGLACLCRGATQRQPVNGIAWLRCTRCGMLADKERSE